MERYDVQGQVVGRVWGARANQRMNSPYTNPLFINVGSLILFPHGLPFQLYLFLYGLG